MPKRFKQTKTQRRQAEQRAERRKTWRKKPIRITQQPKKTRGAYHGRVTFEWTSGPEKGKKFSQPVTLPSQFRIRIQGQNVVIVPQGADSYTWGEADERESERLQKKGKTKKRPVSKKQGKRVQHMVEKIRDKLDSLIEAKGHRAAGKTMARSFIIAHNKMKSKVAKRALAKLYGAVLTDGDHKAAHLAFASHVRRSASMLNKKKTKKTKGVRASALSKLIASGGEIGNSTLEQLVGMAVETMFSDEYGSDILNNLIRGSDIELSSEVTRAAGEYQAAAEEVLTELAGPDAASQALQNDAPFLMFMTQEGHGVGINDGDLDNIDGLDLKALRGALDKHTRLGSAYVQLRTAVEENAYESVEEAADALASMSNDLVREAVDEYMENYKDPDGYMAGEVAQGLGDAITHSHNSLEDFASSNRERENEDLAEAIADAFAAGKDERDIQEAIDEVGEMEFVDGIRARRGFSLGETGEIEIEIDTERLNLDNPYGRDVSVAAFAEFLDGFDDLNVKLDFESKDGKYTAYEDADGYWNFDVDPAKLRRKLRV